MVSQPILVSWPILLRMTGVDRGPIGRNEAHNITLLLCGILALEIISIAKNHVFGEFALKTGGDRSEKHRELRHVSKSMSKKHCKPVFSKLLPKSCVASGVWTISLVDAAKTSQIHVIFLVEGQKHCKIHNK